MPRYEDVIGQFANGKQPPAGGPAPLPSGPPQGSPGMNSAMPGRKPDDPPPMMGAPQMPPMMPMPQQAQVSEPSKPGVSDGDAANLEAQKNVGQARPQIFLSRMPTIEDMLNAPPGHQIMTPYGPVDDKGAVIKTPEYEQKHKEAIVRARQKFAPPPWAGMAGAPEPTIELGKSHFNPFTNKFGRAE